MAGSKERLKVRTIAIHQKMILFITLLSIFISGLIGTTAYLTSEAYLMDQIRGN